MTCRMRFVSIPLIMAALSMAAASAAPAEGLNCSIGRSNLCFPTGCQNSGASQRLILDLAGGTYRLCPNRYTDDGCTEAPMQFEVHDNAIVGITLGGPEISARAVFVNRVTGAISASRLAAGLAGVDFGSCEIPR